MPPNRASLSTSEACRQGHHGKPPILAQNTDMLTQRMWGECVCCVDRDCWRGWLLSPSVEARTGTRLVSSRNLFSKLLSRKIFGCYQWWNNPTRWQSNWSEIIIYIISKWSLIILLSWCMMSWRAHDFEPISSLATTDTTDAMGGGGSWYLNHHTREKNTWGGIIRINTL